MGELHNLLEDERDQFRMPDGTLENLRRRRDRKQRTQRAVAGAIALALFVAAAAGLSVAFLRDGGPTTPTTPTPTPVVRVPVAPEPPGTIDFVDATDGWAVWHRTILVTRDGGATWRGQYTGPIPVDELQFVDVRHGWALSRSDGTLLRTTDGVHWGAAGTQPQGLATFMFATPELGWGAFRSDDPSTPGGLVRSTDGGRTWTFTHELRAGPVCLTRGGHVIWVANPPSEGGTLIGSADGGQSWLDRAIDVPPGERWAPSLACADSDVWVLYRDTEATRQAATVLFHATVDAQRAVPVLRFGLESPDSTVFEASDPEPGPLVALGDGVAFAVGTCARCGPGTSALYATTDGGASWTRHEMTSGPDGGIVLGLSFVSADVGFAEVQRDGPKGPEFHVLATDDGGTTWRALRTGP